MSGLSNNCTKTRGDKIYGGNDTIKSVDKHGTVLEVVYARIRNMWICDYIRSKNKSWNVLKILKKF